MKFPLDVQKTSSEAGKVIGKEKVKLTVFGIIFINFFIAFLTIPFFTSLGISWIWPVLLQLFVFSVIFIFIFRFFIFKEAEKLREHKGSLSDSFSKYVFFRNLDANDIVKLPRRNVPVFEFINGSHVVVLAFRFGINDNERSINTRNVFTKVYNLLGSYNLEVRETTGPEDFSDSPEAREYMQKMSNIENTKLAKDMLEIVQIAFDISDSESNVDMLYLEIKTRSNYQRYELDFILQNVFKMFEEVKTCVRIIEPLDKKELVKYFQVFYGLEAIDLSLMKAMNIDENDYKRMIQIYKLYSAEGKVLVNKEVMDKALATSKPIKG